MLVYVLKPLKGKKKIDEVFSNALKFYDSDAALFVCHRRFRLNGINDDEKRIIGYMVAVKKRDAKKAVVRNRIKRLMRESLIKIFNSYNDNNFESGISELVLIWTNAPEKPGLIGIDDVLPVVKNLLSRAESSVRKKTEKN